MQPVRILILGTGGMAKNHAEAFAAIPGVTVVAGIDTRAEPLAAFQSAHNIPHGFASVQEAIAWGGFDAVTNVTPDAAHCPTTLPFLAAGKHVLCEKPLATNAKDAEEMTAAAAKAGVVNMVNLSYRNVPALQKAAQMVRDGAIGTIRHFEASYLQSWLTQPAWGHWDREPQWLWRLSTKHGSKGVLGDVGIHILDFATFIAGMDATQVSCLLQTFDKAPGGQIGDYVLDANDSATMQLRLANGALGTVAATRFATGHLNDLRLRLYGQTGGLEVTFEKTVSHLRACLGDDIQTGTWHDVDCPPVPTIYQRFIAAIRGESVADPDFARGAALQRLLDRAVDSADQDGKLLSV
ncbi:Gfo/Idh/MocA family protein [Tabrizicola sp.]|jgi:predicted dehydrogenase|uniref:Gfo/Idh/MocA family protein n=1 Tax=Tabrizicola sp. TaxID=2005166 RepID=UPI0035AFEBB7